VKNIVMEIMIIMVPIIMTVKVVNYPEI